MELKEGTRFQVLAPVVRGRKGTYETLLEDLASQGFSRVLIDGEIHEFGESADLARYEQHTIKVVVDRLVMKKGIERRLTESMETALSLSEGVSEIEIVDATKKENEENELIVFSQHLSRPSDGKSFEDLAPRNFSFNSPYGACTYCDGLGTVYEVDPQLVVPNPELTLTEGAIAPWSGGRSRYFKRLIEAVAEHEGISMETPWEKLSKSNQKILMDKGLKERVKVRYHNRFGRARVHNARFEGAIPYLRRRHQEAESDSQREQIEGYMRQVDCHECGGARLNPLSLAVTVDEHSLDDICRLSIDKAFTVLSNLKLNDREKIIAEQVVKEINSRLRFLLDVGLEYLTLSRSAATLAGGEAQRIRLASQIGSGLVGVLYVLDEPSIGLHQRDNQRLIETLSLIHI